MAGIFDRIKGFFKKEEPKPQPTEQQLELQRKADERLNRPSTFSPNSPKDIVANNWERVANKDYAPLKPELMGRMDGVYSIEQIHKYDFDISMNIRKDEEQRDFINKQNEIEPLDIDFSYLTEKTDNLNVALEKNEVAQARDERLKEIESSKAYQQTMNDLYLTGMSLRMNDNEIKQLTDKFKESIDKRLDENKSLETRNDYANAGLEAVTAYSKENHSFLLQATARDNFISAVQKGVAKEISPYKKIHDEAILSRESYVRKEVLDNLPEKPKEQLEHLQKNAELNGGLAKFVQKLDIYSDHIRLEALKSMNEKAVKPFMKEIEKMVERGENLNTTEQKSYAEKAGFKNFLDNEIRKDKIAHVELLATKTNDVSLSSLTAELKRASPERADNILNSIEKQAGVELGLAKVEHESQNVKKEQSKGQER